MNLDHWGIKRIDPDLSTGRTRKGAAVIHWPVQTGGWVEHPDADTLDPDDRTCGVGLHVARTWRAASLGGCLTSALCVVVGWNDADQLGPDGDKVRLRRCFVVPGAVDGFVAVARAQGRGANLRGADLGGANLWGADLWDANLRGADLRGANLRDANLWDANLGDADLRGANLWDANLWGANLRGADLRGANLRGADLWGADLRGADLWGADLRGADLRGADLWGADLRGARANDYTLWPDGFDPDAAGVIR